MNRRNLIKLTAASLAAGAATGTSLAEKAPFKISKKRIRQSVMGWCFKPMPTSELIDYCVEIGIEGIEGISPEHYPLAIEKGLQISLVGSHPFNKGPTDPAYHEEMVAELTKAIDTAKKFGAKRVITFSGFKVDRLSHEQMTKNCVEGWKKITGYAEEQGIIICFEHLNTRDDTHPMKGHPGYFADDVDHCVEMVRAVGSPNFKLLFDIYHVSVMNGDIIRRLREYKDDIGHVHTAGNPGRCEIDENQEINFPAIMLALIDLGYDGWVAQEFIPTWEDPVKALRHAAEVCDV